MNPCLKWLASCVLRLYPVAWCERYEAEVGALLERHEVTLHTLVDLLLGALDARLDPAYREVRQMTTGPTPSVPRHAPSRVSLWLSWVVANTLGAALAVGAIFAVIAAATRAFEGVNEDRLAAPVMVLALAILMGAAQWLVVRRRLPSASLWLLATLAGWSLLALIVVAGSGVIAPRPAEVRMVLTLGLVGITTGVCQWLYLRRYIGRAGWWPLASAVGWAILGLVVGRAFTSPYQFVFIGVVPSAVTGGVLAWLLGRPLASRLRDGAE